MAKIPDKEWLTLCETVTWLAHGEALDADKLAQQGFPSERKFRGPWLDALRRCCDEAPQDGPFAAFLWAHCRNPFNPNDLNAVELTAEELVAVRGSWPNSGEDLHGISATWEAARRIEEDRENDVLSDIRQSAIGGAIKLRGRRDDGAGPSRDYSPIDAAHFDDRHVLNWMLSSLTPRHHWPVEGEPDAYWTFPVKPIDDFGYEHVSVERAVFAKWLKSRNARQGSMSSAERQCERWLKNIMHANPDSRTKKNQELLHDFREQAPGFSQRAFSRAMHKAIDATGASAWRRGGRPAKSAETSAP